MSLELHNYGRGYDYSDFTYQLNYGYEDIYEWLQDSHPKRGDIQITLTSPRGTTSTLLPYRLYDFVNEEGYTNWPFMSVHHWSENPVGRWTLRVTFKSSSGHVSMTGLSMKLYGMTSTPQAVSSIPAQCDEACEGACSGPGPDNCDICQELRVSGTQECVSACPNNTTPYKNYCLSMDSDSPHSPSDSPYRNTDEPTSPSNTYAIIGGTVGGGSLLVFIVIALIVAGICSQRRSSRNYRFQRLPTVGAKPTAV